MTSEDDMLAPFARLLGASVTHLWQLITVSDDGTIPLPGELALQTGTRFITLSHTQQGLSCSGPMPRNDIRWDTEPDLPMGKTANAEEWLGLGTLDDHSNVPPLPLSMQAVTGWFGVGRYTGTFALILNGQDNELVIMTTDDYDLRCATRREARLRAGQLAAAMDLRMVEQELRL